MAKNYKLYNFLVNTYGLSKEKVMEHFEARIEAIIEKSIRSKIDSGYVQDAILNKIAAIFKEGGDSNRSPWYHKKTFDDFLKHTVEDVIKKHIEEKYEFAVKTKKDNV
jgi:hypothetical protein